MKIKENLRQLFLYLIVGITATLTEWLAFYLLNEQLAVYYLTATALAFIISTFVNWLVGKWIMFKETHNIIKELIEIYLTAAIGLLLNLLIMWIAVEYLSVPSFLSKMIATALVFMWNFVIRKLIIYRN